MTQAQKQYGELLLRVEHLFREIQSRHPAKMKCQLGCHSCCKPGLTVGPLEAAVIRERLAGDPARTETLRALEAASPHGKKRCSFLSAEGSCGIYELRPLVCRSHGVPLQFKDLDSGAGDDAMRLRDVCNLNFVGEDLRRLAPADVVNLDTINTLLALLTRLDHGKNDTRVALRVSALLP